MTPESVEGQAARLIRVEQEQAGMKGQLEWIIQTVRAFGNMPTQVGRNTDRIEDILVRLTAFEADTKHHFEVVHGEIKKLEDEADAREADRLKQERADRAQAVLDKRTDFRWKVGTLITLLAISMTLIFGVLSLLFG